MPTKKQQIENLRAHRADIHAIATASHSVRKAILANASPALVEALATGLRFLHELGFQAAPYHQRRARRLMSPYVSKKNKKQLVSGKSGTTSRGGGFFQDVGKGLLNAAPILMAAAL